MKPYIAAAVFSLYALSLSVSFTANAEILKPETSKNKTRLTPTEIKKMKSGGDTSVRKEEATRFLYPPLIYRYLSV